MTPVQGDSFARYYQNLKNELNLPDSPPAEEDPPSSPESGSSKEKKE